MQQHVHPLTPALLGTEPLAEWEQSAVTLAQDGQDQEDGAHVRPGVRSIENQRSAFGSTQEQKGRMSSMAGLHDLSQAHKMRFVDFAFCCWDEALRQVDTFGAWSTIAWCLDSVCKAIFHCASSGGVFFWEVPCIGRGPACDLTRVNKVQKTELTPTTVLAASQKNTVSEQQTPKSKVVEK